MHDLVISQAQIAQWLPWAAASLASQCVALAAWLVRLDCKVAAVDAKLETLLAVMPGLQHGDD